MTTNVSTFASSEMTMRYREPYVTEGLNKKFAGVNPRGCYRGFRLGVDAGAGDRTVNIVASTSHSDHRAVYETATGYSIALRRTGGNFLISLTAYASQTVYVTLFASYSVGATTAAFMRIYTTAEYAAAAEKDELVVLGKVDVPAAGNPITSSMIWDTERDMAWDNQAVESAGWDQVHRNPFFVYGDNGGSYSKAASYWETYVDNPANGSISVSQTAPDVGFQHLIVTYAAGAPVFAVWQYLNTPVTAGQRIRLRLRKRSIQAALAGTGYFKPYWGDKDGTAVAGTNIPIVISAIDAAYVTVEVTFQVPSGLNIALLKYMTLVFDSVTFAAPGAAIYIGGFQMWIESLNPSDLSSHAENKNDGTFLSLVVQDKTGNFNDLAGSSLITHGAGAQPYLQLERADLDNSASVNPVSLQMFGSLLGLGTNLLNSNIQAETARITSPIDQALGAYYTLLWEIKDPTSTDYGPTRIYANSFGSSNPRKGGITIVHNARWSQTAALWTQDNAAKTSAMVRIDLTGIQQFGVAAGTAPWADTAWVQTLSADHILDLVNPSIGFYGGAMFGSGLLSVAARALVPRLWAGRIDTALIAQGRTLIAHHPANTVGAGLHPIRVYRALALAGLETLEIVSNAVWGGASWSADDTTSPSAQYQFTSYGLSVRCRAAGAGTWVNTVGGGGWNTEAVLGVGGTYDTLYLPDGALYFPGASTNTNPASTVAQQNTLKGKNIVKAWADLSTTGGSNATVTVNNGFNITSATAPAATINVVLAQSMANANYVPCFVPLETPLVESKLVLIAKSRAAGSFSIEGWISNTGVQYNFFTDLAKRVGFILLAQQS